MLKSETEWAINKTKNGKVSSPNSIYVEIIKQIDEENGLVDFFNRVYEIGEMPFSRLFSTFVAIPKKTNAQKYEEYTLIRLTSHFLKIFLKIIHGKRYKKFSTHISAFEMD